jgi:MFS transporter, FSR family, fosmidomycin resistance protein
MITMNRYEKTLIGLLGTSHAFSHGYLLIFPAVLLLLQKEFSLDYLEVGIIGNIVTFAYGLGALPGGLVYNRLGPKKLYLLCFFGSAISLLVVAASSNLILFVAGLTLVGVLGSFYHPLALALITQKVREYGKGMGISGAAGNVGLGLAPICAGLIASSFGWRYAFLWFAIAGFALSIWALFTDMTPKKEAPAPTPNPSTPKQLSRNFRSYFTVPLVCLYIANMLNGFGFHGSITFLPTYMAKYTSFQILSLDSVAIGGMLSGIVLFMGVFGQLAGGILSQKPNLERNYVWLSIIAFPCIFFMSFSTNFLLLGLALVYYFINFALQPVNNTLLAHGTPSDMRGAAFGILFFMAFCLGSMTSSFSGYIAQKFGLQWVFMALSSGVLGLIIFAYLYSKIQKPRYEVNG